MADALKVKPLRAKLSMNTNPFCAHNLKFSWLDQDG